MTSCDVHKVPLKHFVTIHYKFIDTYRIFSLLTNHYGVLCWVLQTWHIKRFRGQIYKTRYTQYYFWYVNENAILSKFLFDHLTKNTSSWLTKSSISNSKPRNHHPHVSQSSHPLNKRHFWYINKMFDLAQKFSLECEIECWIL